MSVADRHGLVTIRTAGDGVRTVPYRRAVGLVARGRATWVPKSGGGTPVAPVVPPTPSEAVAVVPTPVDAATAAPETPVTAPVSVPVSVPEPESVPFPTLKSVKASKVVKSASKSASKPPVSVPARKGAEDDKTGYEPSPSDP